MSRNAQLSTNSEKSQEKKFSTNDRNPILRLVEVSKNFPGVLAVDSVSIEIYAGDVTALVGQNGAGKSTLIRIVAGAFPIGTYDGKIYFNGKELHSNDVSDAEDVGIVMIPQEVNVVGSLSVAENVFLNREPTRLGFIDYESQLSETQKILDEFKLNLDPKRLMSALDIANQQLVIIGKALSKNPRVLILDEPTASLTEVEAQRLFKHIRTLRDRGVACIFVSHRMDEVFDIADRIVVMRDSQICGDHNIEETKPDEIIAEMMGKTLTNAIGASKKRHTSQKEVALQVDNVTLYDQSRMEHPRVKSVSFKLYEGEILGLFGLVGSGCTSLVRTIFGSWPGIWDGDVWIYGQKHRFRNPNEAIQEGLGFLTEDRREGLALDRSVHDNITISSLPWYTKILGFLDLEGLQVLAKTLIERLGILAQSSNTLVRTLSGGNQQKVVIARLLAAQAKVLLLDDPTRGVDVGARAEIYKLMNDLVLEGKSILMISSDSKEILQVCDRVLVLRRGRIAGEFISEELDEKELTHCAAGT
jgi:D-xylose transport system ATP-binding protein